MEVVADLTSNKASIANHSAKMIAPQLGIRPQLGWEEAARAHAPTRPAPTPSQPNQSRNSRGDREFLPKGTEK